ncbi:hypothetical protein D3C78_1066980 [compost metagenome]
MPGDLFAADGYRIGRLTHPRHGALQLGCHRQQAGHDAVGMHAGFADGQFAPADGGGQFAHFARLGAQLVQQAAGDQRGQQYTAEQCRRAEDDHQPGEVRGDRGRLQRVVADFALLQVDEGVDARQPVAEGRRGLLEQQGLGLCQLAVLASGDHRAGQRQGAALDLLDRCRQFALLVEHTALLLQQAVEDLLGLGIVGGQALDLGDGGLPLDGRARQHHVAQGDGTVMHAAAEVDRLALLDAVLFVDGDEVAFDDANAIHADQGQDHHHRQDDGETQCQTLTDGESFVCCNGRHCEPPIENVLKLYILYRCVQLWCVFLGGLPAECAQPASTCRALEVLSSLCW